MEQCALDLFLLTIETDYLFFLVGSSGFFFYQLKLDFIKKMSHKMG